MRINIKKLPDIIFVALIIVVLSAIIAPAALAEEKKTITIAADVWCPYNCEPTSYNPGFMIEIVREIFAEKNIEISYVTMPWTRALSETRKGNLDAVIGATKNDATDFVFPDIEQGISKNGVYVRSNETWEYKGLDSLKEKIIGLIENYDYGGNFMQYVNNYRGDNTRIQFVAGDDALELNIKKLINRRIDVIAEDESVMNMALKKSGFSDQVRFAGDTEVIDAKKAYVYIAFSPKGNMSGEYSKIISEGMKKLRSSGRLAEILEKYNVKDWRSAE